MKYFRFTSVGLIALAAGVSLLVGCASFFNAANWGKLFASQAWLQELSIIATGDVNGGYPVALDLVFVTEQPVYDALVNLRAAEWFAGKQDYLRQHQKKLSVMSWEVVPGQQFTNVALPVAGNATIGVLVFADYMGERSYRSVIQYQKKAVIHLRHSDFDVASQ